MRQFINKVLWLSYILGCMSVVVASSGDENTAPIKGQLMDIPLFPFKRQYISDHSEPVFFGQSKNKVIPTDADYLSSLLGSLYGYEGLVAELTDEYISLVNQIYPIAAPYTHPEELAQFGFIAPGTVDPELTNTWFVCRFILMPEARREAYFTDRIQRLRERGSWTQDYIKDLERIHERVKKGEISLSYLRILCTYNLLSHGALMRILRKFNIFSIEFLQEALLRFGLIQNAHAEQTFTE